MNHVGFRTGRKESRDVGNPLPPTPDRKASELTSGVNSKSGELTSRVNSKSGELTSRVNSRAGG